MNGSADETLLSGGGGGGSEEDAAFDRTVEALQGIVLGTHTCPRRRPVHDAHCL